MYRMTISAVIFLLSMFAACSAGEPLSPIYEGEPSATEREQAKQDYRSFVDHCPILFTHYMEDIDAVEIRASSTFSPTGESATYIKVRIKDNTQYIPNEYRAWGHTLHYHILRDGISTMKDQSYQICGWPLTMSQMDLVHSFDTLETMIASTPDHYVETATVGCTDLEYQHKIVEYANSGEEFGFELLVRAGIANGFCVVFKGGESLLLVESLFVFDKVRRPDSQTEYWIAGGLMKQNQ